MISRANVSTAPGTFWYIFEVLRDPNLRGVVSQHLETHCNPGANSYDVETLSKIPLLQSMQEEVGRLRTAAVTVRTSPEDFVLDEKYTIPRETYVMIFPHHIGLSTVLWEKARPRTVSRPLEEFWAERFLVPEKGTAEQPPGKPCAIGTGRFSTEGITNLLVTFGGQYVLQYYGALKHLYGD